MTPLILPAKLQGNVALDLCFHCQGVWFDHFESHQIAPGGIIDLFKMIHAHRDDPRLPLADTLRCPRCDEMLRTGMDSVKSGKFTYHRCWQDHGRFIVFGQFMIEKGFVRQLAPLEIKGLAARIGTVRCSGCGAPIDIRHDAACTHCRAPIAILDPQAIEQALAGYQQAEIKRQGRRVDATAIADALLSNTRRQHQSHPRTEDTPRRSGSLLTAEVDDVVIFGLELIGGLFDT